nr:hypothetical protein [Escherichia coli]
MPNNYTMDLRDCNLLGSAVGIWHLSVRTLGQPPYRVSTRKEKAFDVIVEAYAVSENDGKKMAFVGI